MASGGSPNRTGPACHDAARRGTPALLGLLGVGGAVADGEGVGDVGGGDANGVEGDEDPEGVEEDEVNPLVHEVAGVEVVVGGQPLRAEGDEAAVELHGRDHDHQHVGARVPPRQPVADQARQRARHEHRQQFQADDRL